MKKLKKVFCILTMLVFVLSTHAQAAELSSKYVFKTKTDGNLGQIVTVSGQDSAAAGKRVSLKIWQQGKTEADLEGKVGTDGIELELFALFKQTTADSAGNFSFEFPFNMPCATYKADVMIEDAAQMLHLNIPIGDVKPVNDLLSKVNDPVQIEQVTETEILNFLDVAKNYGIETSIYDRLSGGKTQGAAAVLAGIKEKRALNEKITIESLTAIVHEAVILAAFSSSDDGQLLCDTLSVYEAYLGLNNLTGAEKIYDTYKALDSMSQCVSRLGKTTYTTTQALVDAWKEAVILQAIWEVGYYTQLAPIISDNADCLLSDRSYEEYYAKFKDSADIQEYVLKQLILNKDEIKSVADFRTAFVQAVKGYGTPDDSESGSNSDNGGSTGGFSGGFSVGSSGGSVVSVDSQLTQPELATPVEPVPELTDISGHWAATAINALVRKGIVSGNPDGTFAPEAEVTREEFVKMVVLAFDIYENAGGKAASFVDVPETRWSSSYIQAAASRGVVSGTGNAEFMPQATITREDMATILYRAMCLKSTPIIRDNVANKFKDFDTVSDYAQNSIMILSHMEIVNGDGENFNPKATAKRSEAAQILYNALEEGQLNEG